MSWLGSGAAKPSSRAIFSQAKPLKWLTARDLPYWFGSRLSHGSNAKSGKLIFSGPRPREHAVARSPTRPHHHHCIAISWFKVKWYIFSTSSSTPSARCEEALIHGDGHERTMPGSLRRGGESQLLLLKMLSERRCSGIQHNSHTHPSRHPATEDTRQEVHIIKVTDEAVHVQSTSTPSPLVHKVGDPFFRVVTHEEARERSVGPPTLASCKRWSARRGRSPAGS